MWTVLKGPVSNYVTLKIKICRPLSLHSRKAILKSEKTLAWLSAPYILSYITNIRKGLFRNYGTLKIDPLPFPLLMQFRNQEKIYLTCNTESQPSLRMMWTVLKGPFSNYVTLKIEMFGPRSPHSRKAILKSEKNFGLALCALHTELNVPKGLFRNNVTLKLKIFKPTSLPFYKAI